MAVGRGHVENNETNQQEASANRGRKEWPVSVFFPVGENEHQISQAHESIF